ncbi:MAG: DUF2889 domain-containing protein [Pseudomonadota bacterium]
MSAALHRRVVLLAGDGQVTAALEDDFHHFEVSLRHDGMRITAVDSHSLRTPWASCSGASVPLQALVGCALTLRPLAELAHIDAKQQCTHLYDLALMAVAQAVRGGRRVYDARVTDAVDGRQHAVLLRDGQPCLEWTLEGSTIVAPQRLAGTSLRTLDMRAIGAGDAELAEACMLLRRSVMITGGRGIDFDSYDNIAAFAGEKGGACHAFQPRNFALGQRRRGSVREFTGRSELLLAEFEAGTKKEI